MGNLPLFNFVFLTECYIFYIWITNTIWSRKKSTCQATNSLDPKASLLPPLPKTCKLLNRRHDNSFHLYQAGLFSDSVFRTPKRLPFWKCQSNDDEPPHKGSTVYSSKFLSSKAVFLTGKGSSWHLFHVTAFRGQAKSEQGLAAEVLSTAGMD